MTAGICGRVCGLGGLVVVWCTLCWVTGARAEGLVVLVADQGDSELAAEHAEARDALGRLLRDGGFETTTHRTDEGGADGPDAGTCDKAECGAIVRRAGAVFAAAVSVWADEVSGRPGEVFVTVVDRDGDRYPGQAPVGTGGLIDVAVDAALRDARALRLLGPGPWLRVDAEPDGARVYLDAKYVGAAPYRARVAAGRHRVEVRADGHRSASKAIDVPAATARQLDVSLILKAGADPARPAPPAASTGYGRRRPWVGPLFVGGLGILATTWATVDLASAASGCARRAMDDACLAQREPNVPSVVVLYGLGGAGIVGGLLWHFLGGAAAEDDPGVSFHLSPTGLAAHGRF